MADRVFTSREVARLLDVYDSDVMRFMRRGWLTGVKDGRRWVFTEADVTALVEQYLRLVDVAESRPMARKMAELEHKVERLEAELAAARTRSHREALEALSPVEFMAYVRSLDLTLDQRMRIHPLIQRAQREADATALIEIDQAKRPYGVNDAAKRTMVATAIGKVDVWIWRRPAGTGWMGKVGGPRPSARTTTATHHRLLAQLVRLARSQYGVPVRAVSQRTRFDILRRDDYTCRYCGRKAPDVELVVDHAVPVADAGSNDAGNLVTACTDCNAGKSDR